MSENEGLKFEGAKGETSPGSGVEPEKVLETIQAPVEPKAEAFLTATQFDAAMKKFSADLEEKLSRKAQGLVDKSSNRIGQRVQEIAEIVESSTGAQLTPVQKREIRNELISRSLTDEPSTRVEVAQPAPRQAVLDPVSTKAQGILESFGVGFDKNSPNASKINRNTTDPKEFLSSVKEYCIAETARLEAAKNSEKPNPESQLPIGGEGKSADLTEEYSKKLKTLPRGEAGLKRRIELQSEYRKKGLAV